MAEFTMPSLGADMESAVLTEWMVAPGDAVERGQIVASVETAKGIIDIEIFGAGVIEELIVQPGADVDVGTVLARYRAADAGETAESLSAEPASTGEPARAAAERPTAAEGPTAVGPPQAAERRLVSPAARRRARELGIDAAAIWGTGPGGTVTTDDVEAAAAKAAAAAPAGRREAPQDMRAVIAQAMSRSKREIPHYYLATTIDMTSALRRIEDWNARRPVTERLMYGALLIKAVAAALGKVPELNGFWRDGRFEAAATINVGVAIRLRQGGLVAPAIDDVDAIGVPELMRRFQDLVQRTRAGRLKRTEVTGATITISSLGEGGVETVYPVIHPPQVAIVGFGGIVERPWCVGGSIAAAPVVTATLAADHRVSDGQRGSVFLSEVATALQSPEQWL
jgi:pyruvate dehydrogenase E2 component (dihydrolipoamide acetyltransferase)